MKLPSLTRLPKHKKFNYAPRFYDEVRDDLEQRYGHIENKHDQRKFSDRLGEAWGNQNRKDRSVALRRVAILAILAAICLIFIFS